MKHRFGHISCSSVIIETIILLVDTCSRRQFFLNNYVQSPMCRFKSKGQYSWGEPEQIVLDVIATHWMGSIAIGEIGNGDYEKLICIRGNSDLDKEITVTIEIAPVLNTEKAHVQSRLKPHLTNVNLAMLCIFHPSLWYRGMDSQTNTNKDIPRF